MNQAKVELLHSTPLWVCSDAIRTCWASGDKSDTMFTKDEYDYEVIYNTPCEREEHDKFRMGDKDLQLIDRVGNKFKHASTLEHLYYNFRITGVSRALLQELARHRIASPSVKSTRYTLKELKAEPQFNSFFDDDESNDRARAEKYLVWTGNHNVDITTFFQLEDLRKLLVEGISNDLAKFALPEAYKTELAWSINARSLQNFLHLRTNKAALWEIRELAYAIFEALPEDHKYLFADYIYQEKTKDVNETDTESL